MQITPDDVFFLPHPGGAHVLKIATRVPPCFNARSPRTAAQIVPIVDADGRQQDRALVTGLVHEIDGVNPCLVLDGPLGINAVKAIITAIERIKEDRRDQETDAASAG